MDVLLKVRHGAVPDTVREYAETRIGKLDHYLGALDGASVEISEEHTRRAADRWVVEVTAQAHGRILRAEERAADARQAIDAAHDVMVRQLKRLKTQVYRSQLPRKSRPEPEPPALAPVAEEDDEERSGQIVRLKSFPVKPMQPEEAAEQMELLGHQFFLFIDASSERCAVIYKRRDGQYGLIAPEH
jgi:putative sigma-54 modulation protein